MSRRFVSEKPAPKPGSTASEAGKETFDKELSEKRLKCADEKIDKLEKEKADIEKEKADLEKKVAGLEKKVTGLEKKVTGLEKEKSELEEKLKLATGATEVSGKAKKSGSLAAPVCLSEAERMAEYKDLDDMCALREKIQERHKKANSRSDMLERISD